MRDAHTQAAELRQYKLISVKVVDTEKHGARSTVDYLCYSSA